MHEHILVAASRLSDEALLDRIANLAGRERFASVELIAHLAELDGRPALHLGKGRSLFLHCTQVLHLSEHAAYTRIGAARAARRFPLILDLLAVGSVNVTTVTLLAPNLTADNHRALLEEAAYRTKDEVKAIVRRLAPQPDAPTVIRRLPACPSLLAPSIAAIPAPVPTAACAPAPLVLGPPAHRPVVELLSTDRYRVQVTVGRETHDKLRRLQDLLAREVPRGDAGAIIDRALTLLLKDVESKKLGATTRPRTSKPIAPGSRHVPAEVRRAVWKRDGGRCAFVSPDRTRCSASRFLEHHHVIPFAKGGPTSLENIALRCRAHNAYEAEQVFGKFDPTIAREGSPAYGVFVLGLDRVRKVTPGSGRHRTAAFVARLR